jgi:hypothetical protein
LRFDLQGAGAAEWLYRVHFAHAAAGGEGRVGSKEVFLFWKKETKNFFILVSLLLGSGVHLQTSKGFLVLFFKKERLDWLLKHAWDITIWSVTRRSK